MFCCCCRRGCCWWCCCLVFCFCPCYCLALFVHVGVVGVGGGGGVAVVWWWCVYVRALVRPCACLHVCESACLFVCALGLHGGVASRGVFRQRFNQGHFKGTPKGGFKGGKHESGIGAPRALYLKSLLVVTSPPGARQAAAHGS
jgi:hypothetical protein